ncbi:MAG TPA: MTH938/NDUFAF3 family protein [Anaerolineae bacterium]|nr:MTH938/NDUFAF3 family protein [Anaerolineae bacterium]
MRPQIRATKFESTVIEGEQTRHDVVIGLGVTITKRKKELSRSLCGTSHLISIAEAQHILEKGARLLIIGTGQRGLVRLEEEARQFLDKKGCHVRLLPTPEAAQLWNRAEGAVIALLHVTC